MDGRGSGGINSFLRGRMDQNTQLFPVCVGLAHRRVIAVVFKPGFIWEVRQPGQAYG